MRQDQEQASVTSLELFFDLVFVFALTQVTAFMADELSWHGILRGVLVTMLLWWAWTAYAWLANVVSAEERSIKLAILAGMSAMFVLALCIPEAFDDHPADCADLWYWPCVTWSSVLMHFVMFMIISREDAELRAQVLRFAPASSRVGAVLLLASQFEGWQQTGLWMLALVADYVGTALGRLLWLAAAARRDISPRRHGLDHHRCTRRIDRGHWCRSCPGADFLGHHRRVDAGPGLGVGDVVGLLRRECAAG